MFDQMVEPTEEWFALADKRAHRPAVRRPPNPGRGVHRHGPGRTPDAASTCRGCSGVDIISPEGDRLLAMALLDLYSHALMTPELAATARAGLDASPAAAGARSQRQAPTPEELSMTDAIAVAGLVKTFGRTRALDGLDLAVRTGEVHGFLGPNGAGKTTTIRILLGLMRADAGSASAARRRPVARRHRAAPPARLRAGRRHAVAQPVRRRDHRPARPAARRPGPAAPGRPAGALRPRPAQEGAAPTPRATGRRWPWSPRCRPMWSCCCSTSRPPGLDPLMEEVFRQVILDDQRDTGRTVLLSSHILAEVEALCDRVTIIRDGRAVETGTPGRPAAPDPHLDPGRADRTGHRPGRAARRARPAVPQQPRELRRGHAPTLDPVLRQLTDAGRAQPDQPAADAGGAVPAPLRHRRGGAR